MKRFFHKTRSAFRKFKQSVKECGFKCTVKKVFRRLFKGKTVIPSSLYFVPEEIENVPLTESVKFSVIVPLYNTDKQYLAEMIESVLNQTYKNLELCLADGSDQNHSYVGEICKKYAENDNRVKYARLKENRGISANSNECVKMATGDYIALLDHDDLLNVHALYHNAKTILFTGADVIYSDEDHLSIDGKHIKHFYKPDFSPELLRCHMYICHFLVIRKSLFDKVGGFNSKFDGSQDFDLMLRLSEHTDKIAHVPLILYSWREAPTSTAADATTKPYAHVAGFNALDAHLKRLYGNEAHASESGYTFVFDARYPFSADKKVSVIIPMKDHYKLTDDCVKSIVANSTHKNYEILIANNRSEKSETLNWFEKIKSYDERIRVIDADMEFNWSKINNYAAKFAKGDVLVFLNNDTEVITPDWMERLAENALRSDIGAVGALLLYKDKTVQHGGVVVGKGGWADHLFKGCQSYHWFYYCGSPAVSRNVSAVTGACMAVSKEHFEMIGGFDESFIICGSDVEFCLRGIKAGLACKCLGTVKLYHYESKSRDASNIPANDFMRSFECYNSYNGGVDPYYNVNLELLSDDIVLCQNKSSVERLKKHIETFPLNIQLYKRQSETVK